MTFTNQKLLFISDVHLGGFSEAENKHLESSLMHLIDYCEQEKYKICILGDLFDYWMEYPSFIPSLGNRLLNRFCSYNRNTGDTLFITGNHDNWTRGYFKEIGFDIENDYRTLTLDSRRILLLHGDGLVDPDLKIHRPWLHRFLRNNTFTQCYQKVLPPRTGLILMKYFSRLNRYFEEYRSDQKKLNKWAKTTLNLVGTDVIICGHDHFPRVLNFDFGTFINLGTFYKHKTLAVYNKGEFSLVVWSDKSGELQPFHAEQKTL